MKQVGNKVRIKSTVNVYFRQAKTDSVKLACVAGGILML
jgi:hypothetical protein